VAQPHILTNHASTIEARPSEVWPWLTHMGWHLGGYYTPAWVDRLLFPQNWPSLDHLDVALLALEVGDTIPDGPPGTAEFVVVEVDAPHTLVLHSTTHLPPAWRERLGAEIDWTWSFRLAELPGGTTRLQLRVRCRTAPRWLTATYLATIIPADYVMAGGMLRGIKRRAESGALLRSSGRSPVAARNAATNVTFRERTLGVGMRRRFQARVDQLNLPADPVATTLVSEEDIAALPNAAQRYLRFMGVVGRPRDWSFRARFVGEFRQRPRQKFMPCEAWQYNTSLVPSRVYYMRVDFAGVLPMFGVDVYHAGHGRMHGKLLGLISVADGSGLEFDVSELTTYLNDALMFTPSMLLTTAIWNTSYTRNAAWKGGSSPRLQIANPHRRGIPA
jgi:hypothetical protein